MILNPDIAKSLAARSIWFISLSQAVQQDLLVTPLVPPQLTIKDFYMTGRLIVVLIKCRTNHVTVNDKSPI